MLTFEPEGHEYRWDGIVVPSVTQVLESVANFDRVPRAVLEAAQLRGTNVHLLCRYYDENRLDESQFTAGELAYLPAWERFLEEMQPNWSLIESPLYEDALGFAGTPDRIGTLETRPDIAEGVYDIKTGLTPSPTWGPQTAAYARLAKLSPRAPRFTIQLRNDGTYKLLPWKDRDDLAVFCGILSTQRWVRKYLK